MSYNIGDNIQTQRGKGTCTSFEQGIAVFQFEDGTVLDVPNIEQVKTPVKKRYKSAPLPAIVVKPSTEAQLSDLDKTIAEAQAKKDALAVLK